jgi:hypothetical protein
MNARCAVFLLSFLSNGGISAVLPWPAQTESQCPHNREDQEVCLPSEDAFKRAFSTIAEDDKIVNVCQIYGPHSMPAEIEFTPRVYATHRASTKVLYCEGNPVARQSTCTFTSDDVYFIDRPDEHFRVDEATDSDEAIEVARLFNSGSIRNGSLSTKSLGELLSGLRTVSVARKGTMFALRAERCACRSNLVVRIVDAAEGRILEIVGGYRDVVVQCE